MPRLPALSSPVLRHRLVQVLVDGCLVAFAWWLAFSLRFDSGVPERYSEILWKSMVFVVAGKLAIFALAGLYHKWWRYVGLKDFESILKGVVASSALLLAVFFVASPFDAGLPRSIVVLDFLLTLALIGGSRFLVRSIVERPRGGLVAKGRETLVVGAGDGGQLVVREMVRNKELGYRPIGYVDDDPSKRGLRINGLKVLGSTDELDRVLDDAEPDEVIIAIPSAPGAVRQKVVTACRGRDIPVRTLPTVFELLGGSVNLTRQLREVRVEDVLGRRPVTAEIARVGAYLHDRVVLVTGAGGSIGSELCRQIARVHPRRIVLLDHAEDNLFDIERELVEDRHFGAVSPVLADCKERERVLEVFAEHRPTVIFHAAAYKHVPLMELNPVEALRNNALATRVCAEVAAEHGAERFVLVSTDKAVNPQTMMGVSKAMAEWSVELTSQRLPQTRFASVRFGNVLGSSGSVVPIFRRQIEQGGPVTVTHPEMTRYFMTIPEAVQLIIRSGGLAAEPEHQGAVFVLEMGEPVRILDLARNMIRLSGHEPDRDVAIEVVGPRPGEKLHEELFNPDERAVPTRAAKIQKAERAPLEADWVEDALAQLERVVADGEQSELPAKLAELSEARLRLTVEAY